MGQCTCTTDKEMTCIVHPTDRAMKELITKLEAENTTLRKLIAQCADDFEAASDGAGVNFYQCAIDLRAALLGGKWMEYWKATTDRQERATNSGHATCHKRIAELEAELAELRLETIAATGQAQEALEENARLRQIIKDYDDMYDEMSKILEIER
jgi:hypothetical protein